MNRRQAVRSLAALAGAGSFLPAHLLRALDSGANALPPSATLPDPLLFHDGRRVKTRDDWQRRRAEILATAAFQMYGTTPQAAKSRVVTVEREGQALDGLAIRRQLRIFFEGSEQGPSADLLVYLPRTTKPAPLILGLNFSGNHTVCADPAIQLSRSWIESGRSTPANPSCVVDHHASEGCRGNDARRWPVATILQRGYGLATIYRGDIDADLADSSVPGLRSAYPELQKRSDNFSTIGAWAWTLSRALDVLENDPGVDRHRVAVFGWSRLGKAAVWAGANDPRFAAVISHESGAGGAKLFRRGAGEDIHRLNTLFPHWFCQNFRAYNNQDRTLPFDQHLVLAAIAPRPLYIGSAAADTFSDPEGEFTSGVLASPVYKFLGAEGLPSTTMPQVGEALEGRVSYHIRPGGHDVLPIDWERYLAFLDRWLKAGAGRRA